MTRRRAITWLAILGTPVLIIALLVAFWNWDWFIPLVDARASAALGRKVTITHLHVHLGRVTTVSADGVRIANPEGFPDDPPFATAERLSAGVDVMRYIRHREIVIPSVDVRRPVVEARADESGKNNYTFNFGGGGGKAGESSAASEPKIGAVTIEDGHAHVVVPKLRADFGLGIATRQQDGKPQIVVDADGTYAGQPIKGRLVGGGLLTLRDTASPYPVDLQLANGPTKVSLVGTVRDPLSFEGTDLKLQLSGPNMALLEPLTGVPIPKTTAYRVTGQLDYDRASNRIRFRDFAGVLGNSDIGGTIAVDPGKDRPDVTADLHSRRVDLADLGGFIGEEPGRTTTKNATPEQRAEVAKREASPRLLPTSKLNLPKLRAADVHLKYRGDRIEGRNVPFDSIAVDLDIVDGNVNAHPITLAIGRGQVSGNVALADRGEALATKADVDVRRVDLSRLLSAAGVRGAGLVGGKAQIEGTGASVAQIVGNGNGGLSLFMSGGDISALLADLAGLQFGNAVLSALGIPQRAQVECFVGDWALRNGVLETRALYLDTSEDLIQGSGTIDLRDERLAMRIKADAKHFTIGSLPAPINITGTLKNPGVMPDIAALGLRGGAAAGLGFIAAPLALLPTIQLGLGEDNRCEATMAAVQKAPEAGPAGRAARTKRGAPARQRSAR